MNVAWGNSLAFRPEEKVELLATHFTKKFNKPQPVDDGFHSKKRSRPAGQQRRMGVTPINVREQGLFREFREVEVQRAIGSLSARRAPGPDGRRAIS